MRRASLMARRKAGLQWSVAQRFKGARRWRQVHSEVHLLSMMTPKERRARIKHRTALHFRWRLRGQYVPGLLFS